MFDMRAVRFGLGLTIQACLAAHSALAADAPSQASEVEHREREFAATMAARDLAAFAGFVSESAVFFEPDRVQRGRATIAAAWKPLFEGASAPFSWAPDRVEVIDEGGLAMSTGLVLAPDGRPLARFNSVWRRETDGVWRVVFDKGSPLSAAERAAAASTPAPRQAHPMSPIP